MSPRVDPRKRTGPPYTVGIIAGQLVLGGAERQLYLWLSGMNRDLFQPVVLTLHPGAGDYWEPSIESLGIPLFRIPRRQNRVARALEVIQRLRPFRPQLIHGWHFFPSLYAGTAAKILGSRASLGSWRGSFESFEQNGLDAKITLALLDALLVNSKAAGDRVRSVRCSGSPKVMIVPNAVESQVQDRSVARSSISRRFGLDESEIWIGSMGRFEPSKRLDLLLDLVVSLTRRGERVHLLLIGDGPSFESLRLRTEQLKIGSAVTFTGADPTARTWLSALDLFCFPSEDEGMPNVIMEAAVAGIPIVAWKTPFVEELVKHNVSALLANPGDFGEFERATLRIIHDTDLGHTLREAARSHMLQQYGVRSFIERMTLIYSELLGHLNYERSGAR